MPVYPSCASPCTECTEGTIRQRTLSVSSENDSQSSQSSQTRQSDANISAQPNPTPDPHLLECTPVREAIVYMTHAKRCNRGSDNPCPLGEVCQQWKNARHIRGNPTLDMIQNHVRGCTNHVNCDLCKLDICLCSLRAATSHASVQIDIIRYLHHTEFDCDINRTRFFVSLFSDIRFTDEDLLAHDIENTDKCPICFENMSDYYVNSCKHLFCQACIAKWADVQPSRKKTCPTCRTPFQLIIKHNDVHMCQFY